MFYSNDWDISEPDKRPCHIINGNNSPEKSERIWCRKLLTIIFITVFGIGFLSCLIFGFITRDFSPLDLVWKVLAPIAGVILGYYFGMQV